MDHRKIGEGRKKGEKRKVGMRKNGGKTEKVLASFIKVKELYNFSMLNRNKI